MDEGKAEMPIEGVSEPLPPAALAPLSVWKVLQDPVIAAQLQHRLTPPRCAPAASD